LLQPLLKEDSYSRDLVKSEKFKGLKGLKD
jgi:hypothetical protein